MKNVKPLLQEEIEKELSRLRYFRSIEDDEFKVIADDIRLLEGILERAGIEVPE